MGKAMAIAAAAFAALLFGPSLASAATWSHQDIGSVGAAGSSTNTTNADGTLTAAVAGSGSDIWDVSDEFQFDYQALTGDGTITARVVSLQHTDDWAKAGVMIRESLAPNSRHALVAVTPANGVAFQQRLATGGVTTHIYGPTGVTAPYWVRLTRSGTTFSAYSSVDGMAWTLIGQVTIPMGTSAYAGLAVTSHRDGTLNMASFDHVVVDAAAPPPAGGWTSQDIGSVGAAGSSTNTTNADGTVTATVTGSGSDIWDVSDEFQFDYQALSGDGTITARVVSLQHTDDWAKAGVMIRESLAPNSRHALVAVTPANGVAFQQRLATGGVTTHIYGPTGVTAPYWVRLTRSGTTFSAYSSVDGMAWTPIGQVAIAMGASAYAGLAVTSHRDGSLNMASFDHVTVAAAGSPTVSLTVNPANVQSGGTTLLTWTSTNTTSCTASDGWSGSRATSGSETSSPLSVTTTFTLKCTGPGGTATDSKTVTVTSPGSWSSNDIGSVGATGSSTNITNADGTVTATVKGSGSDIWDVSDEFQFDYQTLTGDGTITARVASETNTDAWAKAGVMIRETLAPNSRHAFVAVTPSNGIAFQRRTETGGISMHIYGPAPAPAPYWVRLTRSGNTFSAYASADGTTWTFVGQAAITMGTTAYVGLAVTAHHDGLLNTAGFDHVTVASAGSPTVSLAVNPANIQSGGTTLLTWTSTNATSCTASDGWSGPKATNGSETSSALSVTTTFTLKCTGPGGSATDSKIVTVGAPVTWSNQDIGSVGTATGSSTRKTNADGTVTFTVMGAGADIWDTADQFQFDYQSMTGDGMITARVATQTVTDGWAKAGVMIRETLNPNSTHALVAVTPSNGVAFQRRTTTGGQSAHTYGPAAVVPYWVRLTRKLNTFTAYASPDGTHWTLIGQSTITMTDKVFVGLAVTSHHSGTLSTAMFDHVVTPSSTITGVTFNWTSWKRMAVGSDNWPTTWSSDDSQYAMWGDGDGFGGNGNSTNTSLGVARIDGDSDDYVGHNANGGLADPLPTQLNRNCPASFPGTVGGKAHGAPLSLGGVLYAWVTPGAGADGFARFTLYKSTTKGCSWAQVPAGVTFDLATYGVSFGGFVQAGKDNGSAIDTYVYIVAPAVTKPADVLEVQSPGHIMLLRVPAASIETKDAYEFFGGWTGEQPTWVPQKTVAADKSQAKSIYDVDMDVGVGPFPQMSYVPGLGRFVYTNQHGDGTTLDGAKSLLTMAEAPKPWGPWNRFYNDGFSSDLDPSKPEQTLFQWNFGPKWFRTGDSVFTLIFSGTGIPPGNSSDPNTNDSWNTIDGSFIVSP